MKYSLWFKYLLINKYQMVTINKIKNVVTKHVKAIRCKQGTKLQKRSMHKRKQLVLSGES